MQANPRHHERQHQGGPGLVVGRHAGEDEDAGADDGADPEARQRDRAEHAAQPCSPAISFMSVS